MAGLSRAVKAYRFDAMARFMRRSGFDALAFTSAEWAEWASNFHVLEKSWERPFLLVVTASGRAIGFFSELSGPAIADAKESGRLWADECHLYADAPQAAPHSDWLAPDWHEMAASGLTAAGLAQARIGIDAMTGPLAKVAARLTQANFEVAGADLRQLRWVKHADEVATMRAAAELSDWAIGFYREELWPGRLAAEADFAVASRLTSAVAERLPDASFSVTSVYSMSGPPAASIHGENAPVDRRVLNNAVTVSQISSRLDGLMMELTRPFIVGKPDASILAFVQCARDAQQAGFEAARAGRAVSGIHAAAHSVVERAGLARYFKVRTGHGIGVIMHDFPERLPYEDRPLEEGEMISIEPGLYRRGFGGFRFADVVRVGRGAPEPITRAPRDTESLMVRPSRPRSTAQDGRRDAARP